MQPVNVAVIDSDNNRRKELEQLLQSGEASEAINLLVDSASGRREGRERRARSREDMSYMENVVARVNRIKPRILLASICMHHLSDENRDLLTTLCQQFPNTMVVLLVEEASAKENFLMNALTCGVRGFIDSETIGTPLFHKMIKSVDEGEAWVPRKLLTKVMNAIFFRDDPDSTTEVGCDSVG